MSRFTDPGHFFQTSHSLSEATRKKLKSKNKNGSPIRLQSKILAVIADPTDGGAVYIAESAGTARRLLLDDPSHTTHIYRGPTNPLTSLALSIPSKDQTLFAGSWDKSIWSWSTTTRTPSRRYLGHTDFVTALLCLTIHSTPILISGSSDASIIIWNISTGEKLHTLKGHSRGILDLAIDPTTYPEIQEDNPVLIFSAGSDRTIRRWALTINPPSASEIHPENPIIQHETSIYALHFPSDDDNELWTASADGTAKCLSRTQNFTADTTLPHGDYVRSVAIDERGGWVITAGRDEHVKVWDRATGKLHHTYVGHFEEVTGLVLVGRQRVVSVSIDMTVRVWSLKRDDLGKARELAEMEDNDGAVGEEGRGEKKGKVGGMTEEEERELEDLMADSD